MKFETPKYSQHLDVEESDWQDKSCGILCLKTLLDYWGEKEGIPHRDADELIQEGLSIDGYIPGVGWKHKELVELARQHGFDGENLEWPDEHPDVAFNKAVPHLMEHPIMASVHKNLIEGNGGHLVVVTGYEDGKIFYNDPDSELRDDVERSVTLKEFLDGWKQRIVVIHPEDCECSE
jgi:ABC-type bacteriocin/lantibiotic exporter with double-glycine peptidase domain